MKSIGIVGVFILFISTCGICAAIFTEIFIQSDNTDLTNETLNSQIMKNYSDLESELKDTGTWINSLDNQVKSLKADIDAINQEKADALKAKEIKADEKKEYTQEELDVIQKQIDELEITHNLINALIIASNQDFSKKTEDVIKLEDEEEQAAREERRKIERVQEKIRVTEYIKDNFAEKLTNLKGELKLSDGQEKAVGKILEDLQTKILDLRYPEEGDNGGRGNRQEMMRKFIEIQINYEADVGKVLTPNQFDDFKSKNLNSLFPNQRGNRGNRNQ